MRRGMAMGQSGPILATGMGYLPLMILRCLAFMLALLAGPLTAQTTGLTELSTRDDTRGWTGVGRLDISGKGFCTGSLITENVVLTAAHCVHDASGARIEPHRIRFLAGFRGGQAEAYRGIARIEVHPDYVHGDPTNSQDRVSSDMAVLRLDQPIRTTRIRPFRVSYDPRRGTALSVVSYAHDRRDNPALQEVCMLLGVHDGVMVMTCDVDFGSSGAPVFADGPNGPEIVAVISAKAELNGQKVSLGTSFNGLPDLILRLDRRDPSRLPSEQRFISAGERNETGARFVSPGD